MVNSFQLNWKGVGLTFWQMVLLRLCWMCCCKMTRLPLCWLDCLGSAVYPVNAFPYVPCVPPPYYFPIYSDPISHCISHLTLFERKFHCRGSTSYPTLFTLSFLLQIVFEVLFSNSTAIFSLSFSRLLGYLLKIERSVFNRLN